MKRAHAFLVVAGCCGVAMGAGAERELSRLRVLQPAYPRAFFFRAAEGMASNRRMTYERWERCFTRLMGIEGKCLDEEVPGRSARNIGFFTRFKQAHPDQVVLLHYNGNARDPRYQTAGRYFAGHWLYYNGAKILADVPAEAGESDIRVDRPQLFKLGVGRYRKHNEDVGLCLLDAAGRPDWHASEQVQLLAVDLKRGVLRVRRGCFGTEPRAFPAGRAYAAAHAHEGPWGRRSNLMWFYNHSTRCPKGKAGRTCADVHAAELAARFAPGGELAAFDGLEFDVLSHERGGRHGRGLDCDADGQPDNGIFEGVNAYGIGVVEFCRQLRRRMGEGKIIQADGMSIHSQRAFRILNGIESEGWPTLSDWEAKDWSGGLNRHAFWAARARPPAFNYINHKFVTRGEEPGTTRRPEVAWSIHRLCLAAAVLTDAAVCYSFAPPREEGELLGIWDELRMGTANRLGWLGKPVGSAVHLAARRPDTLGGTKLLDRLAGEGVRFAAEGGNVKVAATSGEATQLRFTLAGVPCDGPDLFVSVTARAAPMRGYPSEMARLAWVGIAAPEGHLTRRELPTTGMCLRGGTEAALDPATGATVRWRPRAPMGKEVHDSYFVHPPWKKGVGYTFWERELRVPQQGRLGFYTGMGAKSPERSDGVWFRVFVAEIQGALPQVPEPAGGYTRIFEHTQKAHRWVHHTVPLAKWAGKRVRLKFVADCGPRDNSTTDHSSWGDAWVLGPGGVDVVTMPVRHMTWVDGERFASSFYFRDVRSRQVNLELAIEGKEPVWLDAVTAHAHPDAMVREFERGVVVANPSPRSYTFDLATLFPGQAFRRLQGSSRQDPETNHGQPVSGKLTVGPKDALFLVKAAP